MEARDRIGDYLLMSGSTGGTPNPSNIQIIAFQGIGSWPSFAVFTPTDPPASAYTPFTPSAFAAQSAALQQFANNGLASIQAVGAAEFGAIGGLFATWGQAQTAFMQSVSQTLADVASKSTRACPGFLSCLFS